MACMLNWLFGRGTTGGKRHGIGSGNVSNPEGGRLWGEKTHNKGLLTKKAKKRWLRKAISLWCCTRCVT